MVLHSFSKKQTRYINLAWDLLHCKVILNSSGHCSETLNDNCFIFSGHINFFWFPCSTGLFWLVHLWPWHYDHYFENLDWLIARKIILHKYNIHILKKENAMLQMCFQGHAAPVLYAAWAEAGLIPVEELANLRKIDNDLEGHPTPVKTIFYIY